LAKKSETVLPDASDPRSLANKFCDIFVKKIQTIRQNFFLILLMLNLVTVL
jgi:hypothetical protein